MWVCFYGILTTRQLRSLRLGWCADKVVNPWYMTSLPGGCQRDFYIYWHGLDNLYYLKMVFSAGGQDWVKLRFHVAPKSSYSSTFQVIQVICKRRVRAPICSLVPTYQTEPGSGAWLAVMLEIFHFQSWFLAFICLVSFLFPCYFYLVMSA